MILIAAKLLRKFLTSLRAAGKETKEVLTKMILIMKDASVCLVDSVPIQVYLFHKHETEYLSRFFNRSLRLLVYSRNWITSTQSFSNVDARNLKKKFFDFIKLFWYTLHSTGCYSSLDLLDVLKNGMAVNGGAVRLNFSNDTHPFNILHWELGNIVFWSRRRKTVIYI